jgi:integrase
MSTTAEPKPQPPNRRKRSQVFDGSVSKRTLKPGTPQVYVIWRAQFYRPDGSGSKMEQTFSSKRYGSERKAQREAEAWLSAQRTAVLAGKWVDPRKPVAADPGTITVARVADEWAATWTDADVNLKPKTAMGYQHILDTRVLPRWGTTPVTEVTTKDVKAWLKELAKTPRKPARGATLKKPTPLSSQTIARFYNVLRVVLRHAVGEGYISANPCTADGIRLQTRRRAPGAKRKGAAATWSELGELVAAMPDRYELPIALAALTGLRAQELWGLTVADWDAKAGTVTVKQTLSDVSGKLMAGTTKTEASERTVSVPAALHEALSDRAADPGPYRKGGKTTPPSQRGYPAIVPDDAGQVELSYVKDADDPRRLLFTLPMGGAVQHSNFYRRVYRPTADALWPEGHRLHGIRFHDVRHSHATNVLYEADNPVEVMKRLGHSQLATTVDLYGRHKHEAEDRLLAASINAAWTGRTVDLADRRRAKVAS